MAINDDLTKIGLNDKEAQTYLALLEVGEGTVLSLSHKSGLKRTTLYEVVDSLLKRGLISETAVGKRKRYVAEPPEKFLQIKKQEFGILETILPTLEALRNVSVEKPAVKFFYGVEGIKRVFADMCLSTDPATDKLLAIETKTSITIAKVGEPFFIDVLGKKKARGLKSLTISTHEEKDMDRLGAAYPWSLDHGITVRLLDDPQNTFNISIYLFQNKVVLIATDQLVAMVMENMRLKKSYEFLFYAMWAGAKGTKFNG